MENEIAKKIISENSGLVSEVYNDLLHPSVEEIGSVMKETVHLLLSPLRLILWKSEQIEDIIKEDLTKRLNEIPKNNLKIPNPEITAPIIQGLTYNVHNEKIREMFLNLLANSMDNRTCKYVHPCFIEIIKQMNSLDYKVFSKLFKLNDVNFEIIIPHIYIKGKNQYYYSDLPNWFIGWKFEGNDYFDISLSLKRLSRLGLIDLYIDKTLDKENNIYKDLENHPFLKEYLNLSMQKHGSSLILKCTKGVLSINEIGLQFGKLCL